MSTTSAGWSPSGRAASRSGSITEDTWTRRSSGEVRVRRARFPQPRRDEPGRVVVDDAVLRLPRRRPPGRTDLQDRRDGAAELEPPAGGLTRVAHLADADAVDSRSSEQTAPELAAARDADLLSRLRKARVEGTHDGAGAHRPPASRRRGGAAGVRRPGGDGVNDDPIERCLRPGQRGVGHAIRSAAYCRSQSNHRVHGRAAAAGTCHGPLTWSGVTARRMDRSLLAEPATGAAGEASPGTCAGAHAQVHQAAEPLIGRANGTPARGRAAAPFWVDRSHSNLRPARHRAPAGHRRPADVAGAFWLPSSEPLLRSRSGLRPMRPRRSSRPSVRLSRTPSSTSMS